MRILLSTLAAAFVMTTLVASMPGANAAMMHHMKPHKKHHKMMHHMKG